MPCSSPASIPETVHTLLFILSPTVAILEVENV